MVRVEKDQVLNLVCGGLNYRGRRESCFRLRVVVVFLGFLFRVVAPAKRFEVSELLYSLLFS